MVVDSGKTTKYSSYLKVNSSKSLADTISIKFLNTATSAVLTT